MALDKVKMYAVLFSLYLNCLEEYLMNNKCEGANRNLENNVYLTIFIMFVICWGHCAISYFGR